MSVCVCVCVCVCVHVVLNSTREATVSMEVME